IAIRFEGGNGLPPIVADPDGIGQVVGNLVQNAARYTSDGGDIELHRPLAGRATARAADESPITRRPE
ncbi:MAG: hypothetical protein M3336_09640, partial [Chloroflexota bacterium]|nr:hypothetical protein [Chloroflexota bacterium]